MKVRHPNFQTISGFTLIEISILLVIIGLIIGGILVGQDLIRAAEVRATVTQIEKYNAAANTFLGKYGALPGDLNDAVARQFGFTPRGSCPNWGGTLPCEGQGDGNGVIEGGAYPLFCSLGACQGIGETGMFWVDLTTANGLNLNLIEGGFRSTSPDGNGPFPPSGLIQGTVFDLLFPSAKCGKGNYVYVWSGGPSGTNTTNYFGISVFTLMHYGKGWVNTAPGMTVLQAYHIDKKMDDGLPQGGRVSAFSLNGWMGDNDPTGGPVVPGDGVSTSPSTATCYDNGGASGGTEKYSVGMNAGAGVNCALSFQVQ